MTPTPEPRWQGGVPMCQASCRHFLHPRTQTEWCCILGNGTREHFPCLPAVRQMAQRLEQLEGELLKAITPTNDVLLEMAERCEPPPERADRATQAAERIAAYAWPLTNPGPVENELDGAKEHVASIIRGVYIDETAMQARAEYLEHVLAKVRDYCNDNLTSWRWSAAADLLEILDEANSEGEA